MIEAELKARLADPPAVVARLDGWAMGRSATYRDRYFDTPAGDLERTGRELRVRTVEAGLRVRHRLTFKAPAVDVASQSKPEFEVGVTDPNAADALLTAMGYAVVLEFTKNCINYGFARAGREFLATVVTVPELDGVFLEVETQAVEDDLGPALAAVRAVMASLGVGDGDLTTQTYTGAVSAARRVG